MSSSSPGKIAPLRGADDGWAGRLHETALEVARILQERKGVVGLALLGSVARGDANESSDIDILVVGGAPDVTPVRLSARLPRRFRRRVSLLCFTPQELDAQRRQGAYFIDHVRREGEILYDPRRILWRLMNEPYTPNIQREVKSLVRRSTMYTRVERFSGYHLFCLAHLYAIGKAVIILALASAGVAQFNREQAFAEIARLDAALAADVEKISALRPFYRLVTHGHVESLPFSYVHAEDHVREVTAAIERIAAWIGLRCGFSL